MIPYFEKNVKLRLTEESLPWGTYTADWNPARNPGPFSTAVQGWNAFGASVEGSLRYGYRIDAINAQAPTFTVTVREEINGTLVYRTRDWQLCGGWLLLSDVRAGVPSFSPLAPCAPLASFAPSGNNGNSGNNRRP